MLEQTLVKTFMPYLNFINEKASEELNNRVKSIDQYNNSNYDQIKQFFSILREGGVFEGDEQVFENHRSTLFNFYRKMDQQSFVSIETLLIGEG